MNLNDVIQNKGVTGKLNWYGSGICFEELKGLTPIEILVCNSDDYIIFDFSDRVIVMMHDQNCCESVYIESITGDVLDLVGNPLLLAEESVDSGDTDYGTFTYTFYKLATIKGYVDVRWNGESNGYYSESVDIYQFMKS